MIVKHEQITSMRLSEYIQSLQGLLNIYGDLPVFNSSDLGEFAIESDDFDLVKIKEAETKTRDWGGGEDIEHYPKRIVL